MYSTVKVMCRKRVGLHFGRLFLKTHLATLIVKCRFQTFVLNDGTVLMISKTEDGFAPDLGVNIMISIFADFSLIFSDNIDS
jgi:hypothetical protein